jgi:thiol-disulfide isomerase/thioredoxin
MRYILLILLIITLFACNRFDNTFEPPAEHEIEVFFSAFTTALQTQEVENVMAYYHPEYLNGNDDYNSVQNFYTDLLENDDLQITTELLNYQDFPKIDWQLTVMQAQSVIIDSTVNDYLIPDNDSYLFYGDQLMDNDNQVVLVELATATWCPSCPYVESALDELKTVLGNQFHYIEYHYQDPLEVPGNGEILNYYNITSMPRAIIQGQLSLTQDGNNTTALYQSAINQFTDQPALVFLSGFDGTIVDNQLNGSIDIELDQTLSKENLYLRYALVQTVTEYTNYAGDACKQVVIAHDKTPVTIPDLTGAQQFILTLPESYPDNVKLYLWLQTMEEIYDPETCKVYNAIEEELPNRR